MGLCRDCQRDISASWCLGRYRYDDRRLIRKVRWVLRWPPEQHIIILCSVYIGFCRHRKTLIATKYAPYCTAQVNKTIVYGNVALDGPHPCAVADIAACSHFDLTISLSTPPLLSTRHFQALSCDQGKLNKAAILPA